MYYVFTYIVWKLILQQRPTTPKVGTNVFQPISKMHSVTTTYPENIQEFFVNYIDYEPYDGQKNYDQQDEPDIFPIHFTFIDRSSYDRCEYVARIKLPSKEEFKVAQEYCQCYACHTPLMDNIYSFLYYITHPSKGWRSPCPHCYGCLKLLPEPSVDMNVNVYHKTKKYINW